MKKLKAILVTGCSGDIGEGIGRVLKELRVAEKLIGCDVGSDHAGRFIFDACFVAPPARAKNYLQALRRMIREHDVELVIPTSDAEIRFLSDSKNTKKISGAPLVLANKRSLDIGLDKLRTNRFLEDLGLPRPWTYIVGNRAPRSLPCIIKSRFGRGSKGVEIVEKDSVAYYTRKRPDDIWQEYLAPEDEEYTCGLYGCRDGSVRSIVFRRRLGGGLTVAGEIVEDTAIDAHLRAIAKGLGLAGSINVQLRLTKKGPMVFEINPRFSSTVVFRHKLGFKDLLWSLEETTGGVASPYTPPEAGIKFYKGYTEYISGSAKQVPDIRLRRASRGDARLLFAWRNDPLTREHSVNTRPISWADHRKWLQKTLDPKMRSRTLYVAEAGGEPIGTVRTDKAGGYTEISYTLAPKWRGRGLGKRMVLRCAEQYLKGKKIKARIKKGHKASEAIARALRLSPVSEEPSTDPHYPRPMVEWR